MKKFCGLLCVLCFLLSFSSAVFAKGSSEDFKTFGTQFSELYASVGHDNNILNVEDFDLLSKEAEVTLKLIPFEGSYFNKNLRERVSQCVFMPQGAYGNHLASKEASLGLADLFIGFSVNTLADNRDDIIFYETQTGDLFGDVLSSGCSIVVENKNTKVRYIFSSGAND